MKGSIKPISREQAIKLLKEGKSVFSTQQNSAKNAKKLMQEAADGKKVVRHDGHVLENGKVGQKHFQKKAGDGSHVFYAATILVVNPTNTIDPAGALISLIGKETGLNNAGKKIFGDNVVGKFVDDWINIFND